MPNADFLDLGNWNAICDRCGSKFKASRLRKTWDNLMCCEKCWEPRQPQDFARGIPDDMSVPWSRGPTEDVFALFCTPAGTQAIPELAIPGCAIPGRDQHLTPPTFGFCTITGGLSRADFAEADCWTVGVS